MMSLIIENQCPIADILKTISDRRASVLVHCVDILNTNHFGVDRIACCANCRDNHFSPNFLHDANKVSVASQHLELVNQLFFDRKRWAENKDSINDPLRQGDRCN